MKTSVDMIRKMGDFEIIQRTEDGYFNATHLLRQWNEKNTRKQFDRFINSPKTIEFMKEIHEQESHRAKMLNGDFQVIKIIKGRVTKNGRTPDRVFMHPFLFIDFAMWLNPKFKYFVVKFVYDQLIEFRHAAGDNYNVLRFKVSQYFSPMPDYYKRLNMGLNFIVFGKHKRGIRNNATEEQLRDLSNIENIYSYNIQSGLIKNRKHLLDELRKEYARRYAPDHEILEYAKN